MITERRVSRDQLYLVIFRLFDDRFKRNSSIKPVFRFMNEIGLTRDEFTMSQLGYKLHINAVYISNTSLWDAVQCLNLLGLININKKSTEQTKELFLNVTNVGKDLYERGITK